LKNYKKSNAEAKQALISYNGKVYDVSNEASRQNPTLFYQFSGHDISFTLNSFSLEKNDVDKFGFMFPTNVTKLWEERLSRYPCVGVLKNPLRVFTLNELSKFKGEMGRPCYLACNGVVYDVSLIESYQPGQSYSLFAGADCSYSLGAMSLNPVDVGKQDYKLTEKQKVVLADWQKTFQERYPIIGVLKSTSKL